MTSRVENTLEQRIEALKSLGAAAHDGPGLRFIESLLSKAAEYDGVVAERLRTRAAERFETFEAAFDAARAEIIIAGAVILDDDPHVSERLALAFGLGDRDRRVAVRSG